MENEVEQAPSILYPGSQDGDGDDRSNQRPDPKFAQTAFQFLTSYAKSIHSLLPFVDLEHVQAILRRGLIRRAKQAPTMLSATAPLPTMKGERSDPDTTIPDGTDVLVTRSSIAMLFLVLALGKVYCHSQPSDVGDSFDQKEIPGLSYYTIAVKMLYKMLGNDLQLVQGLLLAALYAAHFARVAESWTWTAAACRACLGLLHDRSITENQASRRADMIRMAFMTCLQLEIDILAEFDWLPSGIQDVDLEHIIRDADNLTLGSKIPSDMLIRRFSAQLTLRRLRNEWQKRFYPPGVDPLEDFKPNNYVTLLKDRSACEEILDKFRKCLEGSLSWDDTDEPSNDINVALLRRLYYDARCILHRPFLRYALDRPEKRCMNEPTIRKLNSIDSTFYMSGLNPRPPAAATLEESEAWFAVQALISSRSCIDASILSVRAFDNIRREKQLVAINSFTTAHAQVNSGPRSPQ